jgi:integrase
VSIMAYAGLRPSEVKGLRWGDVRDNTLRIERATDDYGMLKATKTVQRRTVKLLSPLAQDLREHRMAAGRPAARQLIFPGQETGRGWTKSNWKRLGQGPLASRVSSCRPRPDSEALRPAPQLRLAAARGAATAAVRGATARPLRRGPLPPLRASDRGARGRDRHQRRG